MSQQWPSLASGVALCVLTLWHYGWCTCSWDPGGPRSAVPILKNGKFLRMCMGKLEKIYFLRNMNLTSIPNLENAIISRMWMTHVPSTCLFLRKELKPSVQSSKWWILKNEMTNLIWFSWTEITAPLAGTAKRGTWALRIWSTSAVWAQLVTS